MDMARTFHIVGYRIIQRWTWLGHFIDSSVLDNSRMDIGHG